MLHGPGLKSTAMPSDHTRPRAGVAKNASDGEHSFVTNPTLASPGQRLQPGAKQQETCFTYTKGLRLVYHNDMPNPKKLRKPCPICGKEPYRSFYKYCSNRCQQEFQYRSYIQRWKNGEEKGLSSIGLVSGPVKRYLREKFENKCCMCGWAKINLKTGIVPLVADHIDGNWKNNSEKNLRLICPNCDALSPTFAALNKGNGRPSRPVSKRAYEMRNLARIKSL